MSTPSIPRLRITNVYVWDNGMVMTFDQFGQQMPNYQGPITDVWDAILRDRMPDTRLNANAWTERYAEQVRHDERFRESWRPIADVLSGRGGAE